MKKSHFIYPRTAIFMATILFGVILSGCGRSQTELGATATQVAAPVLETQTSTDPEPPSEELQITPPQVTDYSLRLLLTIEAIRNDDSPRNWHDLLSNLKFDPAVGTLSGHSNKVTSIAFSPDGKLLASASDDLSILLWDTTTWELVGAPLSGHREGAPCEGEGYFRIFCSGEINSLAFNPDGSLLASAGRDMTVRLWDPYTGEPIGEPLTGHEDWVSHVAFSPDGLMLASASWDQTIRIWDPSTGELITPPLSGHDAPVSSLAFSPDGSMLASGGWNNAIILWNPETGEQIQSIEAMPFVWDVTFSPDGQVLASATCGGWNDGICTVSLIVLWDPVSGEKIDHIITGFLYGTQDIVFSPDGQLIVSLNNFGPIRIWDPITGEQLGDTLQIFSWDENFELYTDLAFSPDGHLLASAGCGVWRDDVCTQGEIRLWDPISDATLSQTFSQPLIVTSVASYTEAYISESVFLAASWYDIVLSNWERSINVFQLDPQTWEVVRDTVAKPGHTFVIADLAFNPDGSLLATASWDDTVRLWDVSAAEPLCEPLIGHENLVLGVAFNHDGTLLASASSDDTIRLWDPQTCKQIGDPLRGHTERVNSVSFSPDGSLLASASWDETIRLWNPSTGEQIGDPLPGNIYHWDPVLVFSPDGSILASAENDIWLWDTDTGQQIGAALNASMGLQITALAFSPDGKLLASANCLEKSFGGVCVKAGIFLWDVETGEQIGTFVEGSSRIDGVIFSPDGKRLISAGCGAGDDQDPCSVGEIHWWDVNFESWIERACQAAGRNLTISEWEQYFSDDGYHVTCPQWSTGE